ncbi:MAG: thiolase family protein [Chloroflexi bacterium]|nr:thiolase family protein [Chloroflexota bacterium]
MRDVVVLGVGMHPFGKFLDKSLKDLARVAIWNAVKDAGVEPKDIQVAYVGNSLGGLITGQEGVRGQVVLRAAGFGGIPVINVENACASATTAFRGAWLEVASGNADIALAVGMEKMFLNDTSKSIQALIADSEIELAKMGIQFTAYYAISPEYNLKKYMRDYDVKPEHFAKVVVKNSHNGSLNPYAQHRKPLTVEDVLNSRMIAYPLTLYMCSSMGDGAAAAILCAADVARRFTSKPPVHVAACALRSGMFRRPDDTETPSSVALVARQAYEKAGIGPEDVNVTEVHDAMAPAELLIYEELGFCGKGEAKDLIDKGVTTLKGSKPVNPSGGLAAKGHPVGATGLAQISEIVWQLRGEAGPRQVANPKVGMTENVGGVVDGESAVFTATIFKR